MILSDQEIQQAIWDLSLIEGITDPKLQIQPASVDLRLDSHFVRFLRPAEPIRIDEAIVPEDCMHKVNTPDGIDLAPGEFVLGQTVEWVNIPADVVARVEGRSTLGRLGLAVHITAGFIDPGFQGRITLELKNLGPNTLRLIPGTRVSQIVFHTMEQPALLPYGYARGSKYQGQGQPIPPRADAEK